ncbi:MAG: HAMP domain-containing histidine kinase [Caldilineaceae bacterium]|nr:HAMP domain-containing histidine kinase [Caldilineaceae bacterium]
MSPPPFVRRGAQGGTRGGPPWHGSGWQGTDGPPWLHPGWRAKRRRFFWGFLGFLAAMLLLIVGSMAAAAFLVTRLAGGGGSAAFLVWIVGLGLAFGLPLLALALGARVFRSYAIPLADLMEAAETVAAGNLAVQVRPRGSPDFQRLASSFNRMTAELARTEQQRRNLTADVAHELRTPLHIIQGNLEGILDGVYAPTPEHIEATLQETRVLARLVDDLRTLSLVEAGELPLVREAVDVDDLLADVVTSFSAQAESDGIDLQQTAPSGLTVMGDAGRLDQVLSNLVANALRYTPRGGRVSLRAAPAPEGIHITVSDSGAGIPAEDLPFIFDRFWRGDRARTSGAGAGSGLGLAIASQLVKAHGGDLSVASSLGQGTTFTLVLPPATPAAIN